MPRFYFDIHEKDRHSGDDVGTEFGNLDAAMQGAARSAAEIGQNKLSKGDVSDVVIEVRDERNQHICTVTASMSARLSQQPPIRSPNRKLKFA